MLEEKCFNGNTMSYIISADNSADYIWRKRFLKGL